VRGGAFEDGELAGDERVGRRARVRCPVAQPLFGDDGVVELTECVLEFSGGAGELAGSFAERRRARLGGVPAALGQDPDYVQLVTPTAPSAAVRAVCSSVSTYLTRSLAARAPATSPGSSR
jgi:hypothetical protein